MEEVSNFSPAMAVPTTVKIPEPITAPMPNAVSDHGPSVFLRQCSGSSESRISLSMDLRFSSWLARVKLLVLQNLPLRKGSAELDFAQLYKTGKGSRQKSQEPLLHRLACAQSYLRLDWPRAAF